MLCRVMLILEISWCLWFLVFLEYGPHYTTIGNTTKFVDILTRLDILFIDCHPDIVIRILEANAYPSSDPYYECGQYTLPLAAETGLVRIKLVNRTSC